MSERDLAEAIHHELISPESIDTALAIWQQNPHFDARKRMWGVLVNTSSQSLDRVLARRQSLAARTGPWEGPQEAVREYRPNSAHRPGGVGGSRPGPREEDGYPGSLAPPKRGAP